MEVQHLFFLLFLFIFLLMPTAMLDEKKKVPCLQFDCDELGIRRVCGSKCKTSPKGFGFAVVQSSQESTTIAAVYRNSSTAKHSSSCLST
ncbi:hypothetical protein BC939DRAFT_451631 [Gamsiella multidivaricata]|uniref:uncharacterized protein n=1 Tax=Gamsiella multidivaricata TaxID=101098 RepID=UPI00221F19E0|nr:uncharacterized protein BC939DRAFT_451631 [Gamsiella multidivaricata]KAI7823296.1 hypothetical protein BC939DRAFT_451631 [Gamsiella multidivaricata]